MKRYDTALLEKFDFFNKLTADERKYLFSSATYREVRAGTLLINEKNTCQGISFIISGELRAFKVSDIGREISLYMVKAGETCVMTVACFMGIGQSISPVSVVATQDSIIAVVPCTAFKYLYTNSPYIQQFIFKNTLEKFYNMISLVERLTFKSVAERLWDHMLTETERGKKPLYATHAQLASKLGTSREVVTRRLNEMEAAGLVKGQRGKLVLLRPDCSMDEFQKITSKA